MSPSSWTPDYSARDDWPNKTPVRMRTREGQMAMWLALRRNCDGCRSNVKMAIRVGRYIDRVVREAKRRTDK